MSKRSTWCEFDKETRKYIKQRDNNRCIICGNNGALQIMHVFVSRAHGGRGSKENGCLGCIKCHNALDNGSNSELSNKIKRQCEKYLIEKENITDVVKLKKDLIFQKSKIDIDIDMNAIINEMAKDKKTQKNQKYCKNCKFLVKSQQWNSTLPSYYCKYRKIYLNKTTKGCIKYVENKTISN